MALTILNIVGPLLRWHGHRGLLLIVVVPQGVRADWGVLDARHHRLHHYLPILAVVRVVHHVVATAQILLSVVLNELPVLCPVVVRMTLHETVRWSVYVLLLSLLQLRLLLLRRESTDRWKHNCLDRIATAITQWLELISQTVENIADESLSIIKRKEKKWIDGKQLLLFKLRE